VRHYVHGERHTVIVGRLDDGGVGVIGAATRIARRLAEMVVPEGRDFVLIDYTPHPPFDAEAEFKQVTFEVHGQRQSPSPAVLNLWPTPWPCYRPLSLDEVERFTGRPVMTFPYGAYTRALAEATNGQPATRLFDLLVEMDLACPVRGPSKFGGYCAGGCTRHFDRLKQMRTWRSPHRPQHQASDGTYIGVGGARCAHIEFQTDCDRRRLPVYGLAGPEVAWGYGGSGPEEGATTLLADYVGFLPRPVLRAAFEKDVIARLPRDGFELSVREMDAWYETAHRPWARGLVVVAGASLVHGFTGVVTGIGAYIARQLADIGFDVYEPEENGYVSGWRGPDRRLMGMLHASLVGALEVCSMIVVPYDGDAIVQAPTAAIALDYAVTHDVPLAIAHRNARDADLGAYASLGFLLAEVDAISPFNVTTVLEAVDRRCAAFECLR
jgi:hypothetical protein